MKDPAVLFYYDTWLTSTAEMDADARGWYLNLILHQFDKKDLPNEVEKLAVLAGVKFSEYERFKQVFEQVLKQKFKQNDKGRLENDTAKEILRKRESFKDKRSASGKLGYFLKYITKNFHPKKSEIQYIKNNVDLTDVDLKDEQMLKQVFEQVLKQRSKLYINGDGNNNSSLSTEYNKEITIDTSSQLEIDPFSEVIGMWLKYKSDRKENYKSPESLNIFKKKIKQLSGDNPGTAKLIIEQSMANNWAGIFDLKAKPKSDDTTLSNRQRHGSNGRLAGF